MRTCFLKFDNYKFGILFFKICMGDLRFGNIFQSQWYLSAFIRKWVVNCSV